jgi:hypothetical protein
MQYDETDMMHCVDIQDTELKVGLEMTRGKTMNLIEPTSPGKEIRVRSPQDPAVYYSVSHDLKGDAIQPLTCSCPSYRGMRNRCLHLLLVERYLEAVPKVVPRTRQRTM